MTCEYDSISQYINDFDINAPIVDTEERDKMCELWGELAYSKIYLLSLCYDEKQKSVVVFNTDAGVYPGAVVVEALHASVTNDAVLASRGAQNVAIWTKF